MQRTIPVSTTNLLLEFRPNGGCYSICLNNPQCNSVVHELRTNHHIPSNYSCWMHRFVGNWTTLSFDTTKTTYLLVGWLIVISILLFLLTNWLIWFQLNPFFLIKCRNLIWNCKNSIWVWVLFEHSSIFNQLQILMSKFLIDYSSIEFIWLNNIVYRKKPISHFEHKVLQLGFDRNQEYLWDLHAQRIQSAM